MPGGDNGLGRGPGKRSAAAVASERRQGSLSRLGDRLVAEKLITTEQLQRALAEQKGSADKLGTILVRLSFITEDSLVSFLSKQYAIPAITVSQVDLDPDVLKLVPEQIARKHSVLPIKRIGNVLTLAMADPTNVFALDDVGFMTGLQILPVVASAGGHPQGLRALYETGGSVDRHDQRASRRPTPTSRSSRAARRPSPRPTSSTEGVGRRSAGRPADQHDPGGRHPTRAPPTSTWSPTKRCSGCGSASTACCTRS